MKTTKIVKVRKAGYVQGQNIPDLRVEVFGEIDTSMNYDDTIEEEFEYDAHILAEALIQHLPGGTLDRLTAALMRNAASSLVVRR